ncbi:MAG: hypothetical protein ACJ8LM_15415, partial [Candidatus Udaeobacter sp.]
RILHGVINIHSGEVALLITKEWVQETHQYFLSMIRSHWRGGNIVLFEDRGSPHTAEASLELAFSLGIELCDGLIKTDTSKRMKTGRRPEVFYDDGDEEEIYGGV